MIAPCKGKESVMSRLVRICVICASLVVIVGGCAHPPNPMTRDYAVRVQQRGLRRIQSFFDSNPSGPDCISICLLTNELDTKRWRVVTDNSLGNILVKELVEALRDHSEPISERVPVYGAHSCWAWGHVVVEGRNSALVITIEESGAHVGDLNGLFVNKPFFRALERFVVQKEIISKNEYYWSKLAYFRKAAGELSVNASHDDLKIDSAEALEKAIKKWPPGSRDVVPPGVYGDIFSDW